MIDELQGGGPVVGSADIQADLGLSTGVLAAALFTVPMLVWVVLDPVVLVLAERWERRRVVAGALGTMALLQLLVVAAPDVGTLTAAVALWGVCAGLATTLAEVALVEARPADVDRTMARWALLGTLGDLLAPVLFAAAALLGVSWRGAVVFGAAAALADAILVLRGPPLAGGAEEQDSEEAAVPVRVALATLDRSGRLWAWLAAATACTLMDELFVSLGSVWMRADGVSAVVQGASFGAFSAGGALGLLAWERTSAARSVEGRLVGMSVACAVAYLGWLGASGAGLVVAAFLLGATVVPMWPAATARAYAGSGRPGLVAALARLLGPVEILAPLALGLFADHLGLRAAMLALLAQPVVVGLVAWRLYPRADGRR